MKLILVLSVLGMASVCLADSDEPAVVAKKPADQHRSRGSSTPPQILYHGGQVLGVKGAAVPVYVIYYGNVPSTTQAVVDNFVSGISSSGVNTTTGTNPFAVNSSYCEASVTTCPAPGSSSTSVSGVLTYIKSVSVPAPQGPALNSGAVSKIIQSVLTNGTLPADSSAIYTLITDPTVKVTGFPNSFCAYHTHSSSIVKGFNIHYAFAPEPAALGGCDGNFANGQKVTPSGDAGADEITDSLMHEFSETVSDPDINAWYSSNGEENGDLCNYVYGTWGSLPKTNSGATYNTLVNGQPYLVQLIWLNKALPQSCAPAP